MVDEIVALKTKTCTICGEVKPLVDFTHTRRDGHLARCKICMLKVQKEWRANNPDKARAIRARAFIAWREKNPKLPPMEQLTTAEGRLCRSCDTRKQTSEFRADKRHKDGLAWRCRSCMRTDEARWREQNIEGARDSARGKRKRQYERNPRKYSEASRRSKLRRKYGLEYDDFIKMYEAQNKSCPICDEIMILQAPVAMKKHEACVDHDHKTGVVRGILCSMCNRSIGLFNDDIGLMMSAIRYLKEHSP